MSKRRRNLKAELGAFIRQYGRRAQKSVEPNDRGYDRNLERIVKQMSPEELDLLLRDEDEPDDARKD